METQFENKSKTASKANADRIKSFNSKIPQTDTIQPKLTIGKPNDKYEEEADSVADQVMRMPDPVENIQRKCEACEEETLQTKTISDTISPWIQTQPIEEEEEELQAKSIQAHPIEEEEEEIMPKLIQRQPVEEEEAPVQAFVQKQEEEEEEPIQTKTTETPLSSNKVWLQTKLNRSKSSGSPLPNQTRSFMETRFGTDFSKVKVHNDSLAVEMNRSIHSQAFTNGNNIYFNRGKYNPNSDSGKKLLAHELTHVVQQNGFKKTIQRITCRNTSTRPPARAAAGQANPLDQRARGIISISSNSQLSNIQKSARLITAIICNYYPQHSGLVRNIFYVANTPGLITDRVGRGSNARGDITVGSYFIKHTTSRDISRRILQVGHELRHILQYRQGLIGASNKNEREFLAFHENALADEFVGTGRMSRGTRRNLIDGALGYYYCLSQQKQTQYNSQKQELLTRRQQINQRAGSGATNPPTACAHP